MRVTQQTIAIQVNEGLQRAYQRVARAQEQVTSGRRINHLADDPIGATRALRLRGFEESLVQYQRNLDNTRPFLEGADTVLQDVGGALTRIKEIALAMANEINGPVERQAAVNEIRQIRGQLLSQANTRIENRFLFGGYLNGSAPFVEGASRTDYVGDNGEIAVQTNPTSTLPINLIGSAVYQGAGVVGGQGVFDVLQDLERALTGGSAADALTLKINFADSLAAGGGFSPADALGSEALASTLASEASFSTAVTVFDDRGQPHNLTLYFAKTGASTFKYRMMADSDEISGGTPGSVYQVAPEGTLEFNGDGTFNAGASVTSDITLSGLSNGASDISVAAANIDFAGSTQLAVPSAVIAQTQTNSRGIQSHLGRIDAAIDQVITFRAEVGARLNSARVASDAVKVLKDNTLGQRSAIEDADVLVAYSDFARFQNAFQAALQSASQVLQPSLLDFLR
jgi:flagellar hook-associated protein 3 FlgL